MKIEGSVALITAGVSGLGFGAVRRVVAMGGKAVMMDINEERGKTAARELDLIRNTARVMSANEPNEEGGSESG